MSRHRTDEEYRTEIIEAIKSNNLFFFEDIFGYVPFSKTSAINRGLHKDEEIVALLEKNKMVTKHGIRNKFYRSNNPLSLIALYKLLGNDEEYHRLANTKQEINVIQDQPLFRLGDGIEEAELDEDNDSDTETS